MVIGTKIGKVSKIQNFTIVFSRENRFAHNKEFKTVFKVKIARSVFDWYVE